MPSTTISRGDAEEYTQSLGQIFGGSWRLIAWAERQGIPEAMELSTEEWVHQRLGGYIRLSVSERRDAVAELISEGMSNRQIGAAVGVNEKTVRNDREAIAENSAPEPPGLRKSEPPAENSALPPNRGKPSLGVFDVIGALQKMDGGMRRLHMKTIEAEFDEDQRFLILTALGVVENEAEEYRKSLAGNGLDEDLFNLTQGE